MNDHAARSNAAYDLLMQKLMKKYPKADEFEVQQCAISARGQLSHSHTCYAGLDLTQIEQAGSLQRVPKITQPMLYGSASTGSGLGQQDPTVYGLRVSHTEPHIKDPHSVAAILNDDSAYGSYASTPHGIHHQRSNDNATIPRPAQHRATGCYEMATNATNQQVTQYNRPASNSVHQQIPFLNGLALNPANYRAGVPSQGNYRKTKAS